MRFLSFLLLCGLSFSAFATQPVPDNLEPLSRTNSGTSAQEADTVDDAEIIITRQTELTVEEFRMGNRLYMIKVTPKIGAPYYLVDSHGDGKFARQESLDSGFRAPQWVIHRF
ncbi:MAG: DUF2782 domain-containing protein [Gallionella sp.]|nr:DUF2782 domain-containing protein [Gallionella sp.]